jgi:hypothetical protein
LTLNTEVITSRATNKFFPPVSCVAYSFATKMETACLSPHYIALSPRKQLFITSTLAYNNNYVIHEVGEKTLMHITQTTIFYILYYVLGYSNCHNINCIKGIQLLRRTPSSGMFRRVALVRPDVSEEQIQDSVN